MLLLLELNEALCSIQDDTLAVGSFRGLKERPGVTYSL